MRVRANLLNVHGLSYLMLLIVGCAIGVRANEEANEAAINVLTDFAPSVLPPNLYSAHLLKLFL